MVLEHQHSEARPDRTESLHILTKLLAAGFPDAASEHVIGAAEVIDAVLSGQVASPGWNRCIFSGWQTTPDGVRLAKRAIRLGLHRHALPAGGNAFELIFEFARATY